MKTLNKKQEGWYELKNMKKVIVVALIMTTAFVIGGVSISKYLLAEEPALEFVAIDPPIGKPW